MPKILVDAYAGEGIHFYWDKGSAACVDFFDNAVVVRGNKAFFKSLIKQLVYLASNDFCLPYGTHLHYDKSFDQKYCGMELILELIPATPADIVLDSSEPVTVLLDVPSNPDELYRCWNIKAEICVSTDSFVHIRADYHGLMFIATVLLALTEHCDIDMYRCGNLLLPGWKGNDVVFSLLGKNS